MGVSVVTTVISVGTLATATVGFGITAWVANILATSVATVPSFHLNRRWTWAKQGPADLWREVVPFWALAFAGLLLSTFFVALSDPWMTHVHAGVMVHTSALIGAHLSGFGALWILQFALLDRLLFRNR
jgi:putative flippase GtrA